MKVENTTDTLTRVLKEAKPDNIGEYFDEYQNSLIEDEKPFSSFMRQTLKKKGIKQQDAFLAADIPERYGYKIISGEKHTNKRDTIIRLALGAEFTLEEAQKALRLYGMAPLYSKLKRDAVLIIAFNSGIWDPEDVNDLLAGHGLEPLSELN